MSDDAIVRAGEYVLGVLGPEEREAVERAAAADPVLAAEIAFWAERFTPLLDSVEAEPPADLFGRITAAIAAEDEMPATPSALPGSLLRDPGRPLGLPDTITVRAQEGEWQRIAKGVERKMLHRAAGGRLTYLIRGAQGARLPPHEHDDDEEMYVLEGDLTIGELTLHAGDFHLARRGARHPMATTAAGCLILVNAAA
jgi:anti-sigma factor ChrR (cupin superfamily)